MDLNNVARFKELDKQNMIGLINGLPDQLAAAWALGHRLELPKWGDVRSVLIAGMGGSAIGADLLAAYVASKSRVPVFVHRDYGLPAWARGEETLVICSSHSGNTEEPNSAFEKARAAECRTLVVTTGGKLADAAKKSGAPLWQYQFDGQPRAAIGYSFGLLLAVFARLGFIRDPAEDINDAVATMKRQQASLLPEVPDTQNSAKRMGGQFMGRWITVYGAGLMAPVARRWKTQINELAKAQATFEILPEADHNTLEGVMQPEGEFGRSMSIFLRAPHNHPRNNLRDELTRVAIMVQGINTDFILAEGDTALGNMWTVLHYGDYTAYYLAMAYGYDPTPVPMLEEFKEKMRAAP